MTQLRGHSEEPSEDRPEERPDGYRSQRARGRTEDLPPAAWVPAEHDRALGQPSQPNAARTTQALPTILGGGVDTVYFSFDFEVSDTLWARLEEEQQIAQQLAKERGAEHCPEWLHGRITPTGARGGYRFLIETPYWSVKLLKGIPHRPPIYVEMRAYGLRTLPGGPRAACELACLYVRQVLLADQPPAMVNEAVTLETARCSRLDLYMDWQGGWTPSLASASAYQRPGNTPLTAGVMADAADGVSADAWTGAFTATTATTDMSAGAEQAWDERVFIKRPHVEVTRRSADNTLTGYVIGKGAVLARLYNKTLQARKAHLDWYLEWLTQRNGPAYEPDLPVWRLEFQLLRAGVKGFALYTSPTATDPDEAVDEELDAEDLPRVSSVAKAFHWADHLFHYLTTRWLRVVTPTRDVNRGRWPEELTWTLLREGFAAQLWPPDAPGSPNQPLTDERLQLVRAQRYAGYQRMMDRMALGLLDTLEAMDTDPGAALLAFIVYMERLAHRIAVRQRARAARQAGQAGQDRAQDVDQDVGQRAPHEGRDSYGDDDEASGGHGRNTESDREEYGERPAGPASDPTSGPDLKRGMGGRWSSLRQAERREVLLHTALGVFLSAGVTRLSLPTPEAIRTVSDLLRGSLPELEEIAREKGGVGTLLEEKWRKVYKASCPRGVFSHREMRDDAA